MGMQKRFAFGAALILFIAAPRPPVTAREVRPALTVEAEIVPARHVINVKLTVVNRSGTYQIFEGMSCSWQENWQTNDRTAAVTGSVACTKNAFYSLVLAPGERHVQAASPLSLRGKAGRRVVRFGYTRRVTNFTAAELKKIHDSGAQFSYFSRGTGAPRFGPRRETFWSAPVTVHAPLSSLLH